jgi:DNA polymerase III delta subunit
MAYDLLELAIKGDEANLRIAIKDTQIISDPYKTFGLLVSQFFNISAIVLEPNHPTNIIAEKLGVNLFVLNKLKSSARSLSIGDLRRIILEFTDADRKMKTSSDDPWANMSTAPSMFYLFDNMPAALTSLTFAPKNLSKL